MNTAIFKENCSPCISGVESCAVLAHKVLIPRKRFCESSNFFKKSLSFFPYCKYHSIKYYI